VISFDATGNLFVGRDNSGSGGGVADAVRIHKISPGGTIISEYGISSIVDPDGVIVDINGIFGAAGSVITGGQVSNSQGGFLSAIRPDESVDTLFGLTTTFHNPSAYAFDSNNRLLFSNVPNPGTSQVGIYATTGIDDDPSLLFSSTSRIGGIAIDASDQIYVSTEDGRIEVHALDGSLIDSDFVTDLRFFSPLAFGSLGSTEIDLFALDSMGDLLRIDTLGNKEVIGSGFNTGYNSIQFGPDGSLYASDFAGDRILKVSATPPSIPEPNTLAIFMIFSFGAC
jgi:sugar lactone lactonase YvrE